MLKDVHMEEIRNFLSSTEIGEIKIDHVDIGRYEEIVNDSGEPETWIGFLIEERSLEFELRLESPTLSEELKSMVINSIDIVNSDRSIIEPGDLCDFLDSDDTWWKSGPDDVEVKIDGRKIIFSSGEITRDSNEGGKDFRYINFNVNGISVDISFELSDQLSVTIMKNIVYSLTKKNNH